uniref:Uncharacterized protein n=1 Tax=viral metagenome TaxID=1070528 RepID=A0A6C0CGT4_9ZZZZ
MNCHNQLSNYTTSNFLNSAEYMNVFIMLTVIGFFYLMLFNYFF